MEQERRTVKLTFWRNVLMREEIQVDIEVPLCIDASTAERIATAKLKEEENAWKMKGSVQQSGSNHRSVVNGAADLVPDFKYKVTV